MKSKNKIIKKVGMLAFLCVACPIFVFGGCSRQNDPVDEIHMHTYDKSKYESDELGHWFAPACEHVSLRGDYSRHVYDDEYDATCNVCGYEREVPARPTEEPPVTPPVTEPDTPSEEQPVVPPTDNPSEDDPPVDNPDTPSEEQPDNPSVDTPPDENPDDNPDTPPVEDPPASPILGVSVQLKSGLVTEVERDFILNADCLDISVTTEVEYTIDSVEFLLEGGEYAQRLALLPAENAYSITVRVSVGYSCGEKTEAFIDNILITVTQKVPAPPPVEDTSLTVDGDVISTLPESIESQSVLAASGENSVVITPQTDFPITTVKNLQIDGGEVPAICVDANAGEYSGIKISVTMPAVLKVYATSFDFAAVTLMQNGEPLTDYSEVFSPTTATFNLSNSGEYNLVIVGVLQIYKIEVSFL